MRKENSLKKKNINAVYQNNLKKYRVIHLKVVHLL